MPRKLSYSFPSLEVAGLTNLEPQERAVFQALTRNLQQLLITLAKGVNEVAQPDYGTTAARPTADLELGQMFFDSTIGKPIWLKATTPSVVWVDSTGAAV